MEAALTAGISGGITGSASLGIDKAIGPAKAGAQVGVDASLKGTSLSQHQTISNHDFGSSLTSDQRQQLAHDVSSIKSFTATAHTDNSNTNVNNLVEGIRSDWNKTDNYSEQYNAQYTQEQSLRSSINSVKSWDSSTDHNQTTQFMNWLGDKDSQFAQVVGTSPSLTRYQEDKLNGMISNYVEQNYMPGASIGNNAGSSIAESYQSNANLVNTMGNQATVQNEFNQQSSQVKGSYKSSAVESAGSVASDVKTNSGRANDVLSGRGVQDATNHLNTQVEQKKVKDTAVAKEGAATGAWNAVFGDSPSSSKQKEQGDNYVLPTEKV